jgi:hypothetical protein
MAQERKLVTTIKLKIEEAATLCVYFDSQSNLYRGTVVLTEVTATGLNKKIAKLASQVRRYTVRGITTAYDSTWDRTLFTTLVDIWVRVD